MAQLLLPHRLRKQPQFNAQVDLDNPLTRGLVFLCNRNEVLVKPLSATLTRSGVQTLITDRNGQSLPYNGSNVDLRLNESVVGTNPEEATLFAFATSNNSALEMSIVGCGRTAFSDPLFRLEQRTSAPIGWTAQFRTDSQTNFVNASTGVAVASGESAFLVGVFRKSGQKELWVNGILRATDSTIFTAAITLDLTSVGVLYRGSTIQWWNGAIPLAGITNRALSAQEVVELSSNPWQIFRPLKRRIFVDMGAGGSTTMPADSGSFAITGSPATFRYTLNAGTDSFDITGTDVVFREGTRVSAESGTFNITGTSASFSHKLTAESGSVIITGTDANFTDVNVVDVDPGSFLITGTDASFNLTAKLDPGSFSISGTDATFDHVLNANSGSVLITGQDVTFVGDDVVIPLSRNSGMLAAKHTRRSRGH